MQSASLAAVALSLSGAIASESGVTRSPLEAKGSLQDETVVGGVCEMCFWRCQLVGKTRIARLVKLDKQYIKGLQNGAKLIVVDPRSSASAAKSDIWVKIKPGTDTAFLLAIMNYLVTKNKYDAEFIEEHGQGFDEFKEGIKAWSLEKAAKECDIPAAQIKEVAEMLAANAPNVSIHPGRHVSWYGNDFQRQRSLACLTGLLGAYFSKAAGSPGKDRRSGKPAGPKKNMRLPGGWAMRKIFPSRVLRSWWKKTSVSPI